jgi:hypothetical protein
MEKLTGWRWSTLVSTCSVSWICCSTAAVLASALCCCAKRCASFRALSCSFTCLTCSLAMRSTSRRWATTWRSHSERPPPLGTAATLQSPLKERASLTIIGSGDQRKRELLDTSTRRRSRRRAQGRGLRSIRGRGIWVQARHEVQARAERRRGRLRLARRVLRRLRRTAGENNPPGRTLGSARPGSHARPDVVALRKDAERDAVHGAITTQDGPGATRGSPPFASRSSGPLAPLAGYISGMWWFNDQSQANRCEKRARRFNRHARMARFVAWWLRRWRLGGLDWNSKAGQDYDEIQRRLYSLANALYEEAADQYEEASRLRED